ncbi:MAG: hypothetical protein WD333_02195 [Dehalococcoidia bacterium]
MARFDPQLSVELGQALLLARRQHHLLNECGFADVVSQANGTIPSREAVKAVLGIGMEKRMQRDEIVDWAERGGLSDRESLAAMGRACLVWAESDDVFLAVLGIASVGYRP